MAVWSDDDDIACVHPGGGARLSGAAAIRASFEAVFAKGPIPLQPHSVRRMHTLGCAVHHVVERIALIDAKGPRSAWVLATNVYLKTAQGWRMVVHHASPGSELAEPAPGAQRRSIVAASHRDDIVKAALKKWPNVPHCYGWLALDARGDWYMRDDRI